MAWLSILFVLFPMHLFVATSDDQASQMFGPVFLDLLADLPSPRVLQRAPSKQVPWPQGHPALLSMDVCLGTLSFCLQRLRVLGWPPGCPPAQHAPEGCCNSQLCISALELYLVRPDMQGEGSEATVLPGPFCCGSSWSFKSIHVPRKLFKGISKCALLDSCQMPNSP